MQAEGAVRSSGVSVAHFMVGADRLVLLLCSRDPSVPFLATRVSSQMIAASTEISWAQFLSMMPLWAAVRRARFPIGPNSAQQCTVGKSCPANVQIVSCATNHPRAFRY